MRSGDGYYEDGDAICISKSQQKVHQATEALAVFVAAPFTAWLALKPSDKLEPWERTGLGILTIGTLIVDGGLLISWLRKKKRGEV